MTRFVPDLATFQATMSVRQHLIGFSICLAVGMVLSLIGAAVVVVLELPHEVVADSTDMDYVRPMFLWAITFAIACAVARAYVARRRSAPVRHHRVT